MPVNTQARWLLARTRTSWAGPNRRRRLAERLENDFLIDREVQRPRASPASRASISQDQAVTESMGVITDHSFENLAVSDRMVAITRRRLLEAAKALARDRHAAAGRRDGRRLWPGARRPFPRARHPPWPEVYHQQLAAVRDAGATVAAE